MEIQVEFHLDALYNTVFNSNKGHYSNLFHKKALMTQKKHVCAVIQAGGPGTRMGQTSKTIPKHLLPVGGMPMVERIFRQLLTAGVRKIYIIIGHLGELIETHFAKIADWPENLELTFIRETAKRGDIGALTEVPAKKETVLWVYGDLVTDLDFSALLQIHRQRGCAITLASHFEFHQVRLGELIVEGDHVHQYLEKPVKRFLICSGIAAIEPTVLPLLEKKEPMGLDELVAKAIAHGFHVTHWQHASFWMDVNDPCLLQQAQEALNLQSDA
jgi:NDP-sugar pyrophosphorylase family protein